MVLTQQAEEIVKAQENYLFPYHYGSYATTRRQCLKIQLSQVSIPLWFLRNTLCHFDDTKDEFCFHTTMVLTQPVQRRPRRS